MDFFVYYAQIQSDTEPLLNLFGGNFDRLHSHRQTQAAAGDGNGIDSGEMGVGTLHYGHRRSRPRPRFGSYGVWMSVLTYCPLSYQKTLATLNFADSKTLKEEQREEMFKSLKVDENIGWAVDVIDPRELSAKMLRKYKINLNEISHESAMGLVSRVLNIGVLLTEVYVDTVGDPEKYRVKLSERFPSVKFVVSKKADSLFPVVSGASIVAKVTRDRALRSWVFEESVEIMHKNYGSGYPGDPKTKTWMFDHKHQVFGFPNLVRFSWASCAFFNRHLAEVLWEADVVDEGGASEGTSKRQLKLTNVGFSSLKRKSEDIESSGKGRCKFFQARKLEMVTEF